MKGDMKMKGYKAFNKDLTCRGMQYEIGKEFTFDGKPIPCRQGFHFCETIADCYEFYAESDDTRICEVEAVGDIAEEGVKRVTNKIRILAEITCENLRKGNTGKSNSGYRNSGDKNSGDSNSGIWNSGNWNSGYRNSGDRNSGNRNSGNWNSGNRNSGDRNSGYWNSGDRNSGDRNSGNRNSGNWNSGYWNSGYRNSGDRNSGNWNSGYWNSGDWNSGDRNSGIFCTEKEPKIKIFDKDSDWTFEDWYESRAYRVMKGCPYSYSDFIDADDMSDKEKENHPEYKTIGGYVKIFVAKAEDKQAWWNKLSSSDKEAVKSLPGFDKDKFRECTEITV